MNLAKEATFLPGLRAVRAFIAYYAPLFPVYLSVSNPLPPHTFSHCRVAIRGKYRESQHHDGDCGDDGANEGTLYSLLAGCTRCGVLANIVVYL